MTGWNDSDLDALRLLQDQRQRDANRLARTVAHLRAQGCPWSMIADTLGVTKQAAQQRYGKQPAAPETVETEPMF